MVGISAKIKLSEVPDFKEIMLWKGIHDNKVKCKMYIILHFWISSKDKTNPEAAQQRLGRKTAKA